MGGLDLRVVWQPIQQLSEDNPACRGLVARKDPFQSGGVDERRHGPAIVGAPALRYGDFAGRGVVGVSARLEWRPCSPPSWS